MKFVFLELRSSEIRFLGATEAKHHLKGKKKKAFPCSVIGMKVLKHSCFYFILIFFMVELVL